MSHFPNSINHTTLIATNTVNSPFLLLRAGYGHLILTLKDVFILIAYFNEFLLVVFPYLITYLLSLFITL